MQLFVILFVCGAIALVIKTLLGLRSNQPKGTKKLPGPRGTSQSIISIFLHSECDQCELTFPLGKPFIGSDLGKGYFWFKFDEWASQYGKIYQYRSFNQVNVVVNTEKIANDLLRERGNIYSSREQFPMASHLLSDNKRALFLPYSGTYEISPR